MLTAKSLLGVKFPVLSIRNCSNYNFVIFLVNIYDVALLYKL